jgi:hypothetical protein
MPEMEGQEQSREEKTRELLGQIMQSQDIDQIHQICQQIIDLEQQEAQQEGQETPKQNFADKLGAAIKAKQAGQEGAQ